MSDDRIKRLAREQRAEYLAREKAPDDRPLRPYPLHKPRSKRGMLGAGVVLALLAVVYGGITAVDRIVDPAVPLEGTPDAPGPTWDHRVLAEETGPAGDGRGMPNAAALWPGGGETAVFASPLGMTAQRVAESDDVWTFSPEGGHLCAATEEAAGDDGGTGVVVVGREEAADEDGADSPRIVCDTVVALDLDSGEERWRLTPSEIDGAEDLRPGAVRLWADGARTVAAWGPLTVGIDTGSGEELWSAPELDVREEACTFAPAGFSADGRGGAALLGGCGRGSRRTLTTVLDTGTGETSRTRALPSASGMLGSRYTLVSADPVAVLFSPGLEPLLSEDDGPQDELFTADGDGDGWTITRPAGEAGFGPAKTEWSLGSGTTLAARDGVLYATPGGAGGWARVVALDLATGRTLWDRRLAVRDLDVIGFSGDRLLAAAAIEGDGDDAEVTTRLLDLPTDGEGPAQVLATDLPELPAPATSGGPWAVAVGDGYAVGTAPRDPDRDGAVFVVAAS